MRRFFVIISISIVFLVGCSNYQLNNLNQLHNSSKQEVSTSSVDIIDKTPVSNNDINDLDKICGCEKTFNRPYSIDWSGQVIATFVSGADIGVRKFDQSGRYKQFYVGTGGLFNGKNGDSIRIKGKMVGITCAYYNTVFHECVADVIADSVEKIK